ncbi:chaperone protein DnaJ [Nitzschia inconspicua]|uniref:Chaperone protein DnaJ n=1 Tax=Nitzschia inconspicua TaxID=303405 RepID=A0A9K3PXN9_9STRA|nr:chaperone protein DnaJ [Nitzschia inconspicua]
MVPILSSTLQLNRHHGARIIVSVSMKRSWRHCQLSVAPLERTQQQRYRLFAAGSNSSTHDNNNNASNNNNNNHQHRRRTFPHHTVRAENPFEILGIQNTATYQQVKRRFVELALQHHPDKVKDDDDKEQNMEKFVRFRQAFEALRDDGNGMATTRDNSKDDESSLWSSDEEFNAWFYEETGHSDIMFRMDISTRKEVIDVVHNQAQGGLDRGGMWEMARKMAEQEELLKDKKRNFKKTPLGLEGSGNSSSSSGRRRRKRGG